MPHIAIRKDFKFDHVCPACRKPLTTSTGYLLRDPEGNEDFYGKRCAEKLTQSKLRGVPDLTRAQRVTGAGSRAAGGGRKGVAGQRDQVERAARYLTLRQVQLRHIPGTDYPEMQPAADRLADGNLTAADVARVLRIEAYNAEHRPEYSLRNLQTVYAYDVALTRALTGLAVDKRRFTESAQAFLRTHLYLTEAQVQGVHSWLARIPNFLVPDPGGFFKS